jgi:hypothetical protein
MLVRVTLFLVASPCLCQMHSGRSKWITFTSRSGWLIRYPRAWRTSSCMACPDPHAAFIYVSFAPRTSSGWKDGTVTITPLMGYALNATGEPLQNLADDFARANRLHRLSSWDGVLAGNRALFVRYGHSDAPETEEVTFSFLHDIPIEITYAGLGPLEGTANFPLYERMLSTFASTEPAKSPFSDTATR